LLGLAALYVGVPYAPLATAYSLVSSDHGKLRNIAALLKPGAVFADDGATYGPAITAIARTGLHVINARNGSENALSFEALLQSDPAPAATARAGLGPDTVAKYLFTSSSTGAPKAVINTNGMIFALQAMVRDCYRFLTHQPPVVLDWAPWNHTAAGNKVFYLVLTNGGTYYIDDGRPVAGKFDRTLENLRNISCTWYFKVPVGFDLLVDALARTLFADLGMLFYAGAAMLQRTWERLAAIGRATTGHEVLLATGLGATETAPFALACTDVQNAPGNIGVPALGLTLKLVPSDGKWEARIKGPSVMPGYYGDAARTTEVFDAEGFYCLGDARRPSDPDDFTKGFFRWPTGRESQTQHRHVGLCRGDARAAGGCDGRTDPRCGDRGRERGAVGRAVVANQACCPRCRFTRQVAGLCRDSHRISQPHHARGPPAPRALP